MELKIRWALGGRFADVYAVEDSARIVAEFLDKSERKALADHLRDVADELHEEEEEPTDASD